MKTCRKLCGVLLLFDTFRVIVNAILAFFVINNVIWDNVKCNGVTDHAWESDSLELWDHLAETLTHD